MWDFIRTFAEAVISLLAITNPIGNLPVFMSLTEDLSVSERRYVLRVAGTTAFAIIIVMALLGHVILEKVFHIKLDEFMLGGGVILVVVGISSIMHGPRRGDGRATPESTDRRGESISIAVTPMASPLLVGPGSIVTAMVIVRRWGVLFGLAAIVTTFLLIMVVLHFGTRLDRLMGRVGSLAVGRIMQIFIVAMGVSFVVRSLATIFPALTAH
jgi:multiple antibiotic resistance protein